MSEEVQSKIMGRWHHPKIGKGADGRAAFLPNMEYAKLMRDGNFKVWVEHYRGKSSRLCAKTTVYRLMQAGDLSSPTEFLELPLIEAKNIVRIVCNDQVSKGYGRGAASTLSFAKNFYNYHNEDLGKEMKFKRQERPVITSKKIAIESIPHNSDIAQLADVAMGLKYKDNLKNKLLGLRNRAILLFLWQSGVRVNALTHLTYANVKDYVEGRISLEYLKDQFKEANIEYWIEMNLKVSELPPLFLKVTPDLDTKIGSYGLSYYVTFLHHEGFKALKEWLDFRVETAGKPLKPSDYVFVAYDDKNNQFSGKPITSHLVNHMLKTVAGRAGLNGERIWVHVLRKSFRKVLRDCPTMDEETKEAVMGHKLRGSQGNYFDYHDIVSIAKKYMECDWTRGASSKLNGLAKKVDDQETTIKKLQDELQEYKLKEVNQTQKADRLDEMLKRLEAVEKMFKKT